MTTPPYGPAARASRRMPLVRVSAETHAQLLRLAAAEGASAAAVIGRLVEAERRRRIVDDFVRDARDQPVDLLGEAKGSRRYHRRRVDRRVVPVRRSGMSAARIARGDVWLADLNPIRGREQSGTRPIVIVSAPFLQRAGLVVVVPFTTRLRGLQLACVGRPTGGRPAPAKRGHAPNGALPIDGPAARTVGRGKRRDDAPA
jgi:hypothetical protein